MGVATEVGVLKSPLGATCPFEPVAFCPVVPNGSAGMNQVQLSCLEHRLQQTEARRVKGFCMDQKASPSGVVPSDECVVGGRHPRRTWGVHHKDPRPLGCGRLGGEFRLFDDSGDELLIHRGPQINGLEFVESD